MRVPPKRQLFLAGIVVIAIVSTVLIASLGNRSDANGAERWTGSWAMAATAANPKTLSLPGFNNQTIRMTMHASVGGDSARIRLSNAYGTKTLTVGDVTVGIPTKSGSGAVRPGTLHEVLFGGRATATIPRGATLMSDAIPINVAPNSDLVISIWLPTDTGPATWHVIGRSTTWIGKGDHSEDISAAGLPTKDTSWYFVTGIDVRNTTSNGSVVVFGDSISDGFTATVDADHRWPDRLAARLDALAASKHAPGILDLGTAGSALGHDGAEIGVPELGRSSTGRIDADVFAQTGVRTVIIELGINDIWIYHDSPDAMIAEERQIAAQLHEHGIKVYVCTVSPWQGYAAYTPALEATRVALNNYIRTSKEFDGYIDFDKLLRDPETPTRLKTAWDSGDHIHPNDAGYLAMASYVPMKDLIP